MNKLFGSEASYFLFDLDGTLCDSEDANFQAYRSAFALEGILLGDGFRRCFGARFDVMAREVAPSLDSEALLRVRKAKSRFYREGIDRVIPKQPILDFARAMAEQHTAALVTSASRVNAQAVLAHLGISRIFKVTVFGEDVKQAKPHPESYLHGLALLGATPDCAIAFEDSDAGVTSARAAGITVIRVS